MDDVEILACLGLDDAFRVFLIVLPLSHGIYNDDLDERMILQEYCRNARRSHRENKTMITDLEMTCVRGGERGTFLETLGSLDAEISTAFGSYRDYSVTATINFQFQEFILRYLLSTDLRSAESLACVPRDVFGQLHVEETLETVRRNELFGPRAGFM